MIVECERCGRKTAKVEVCNYCGRAVCYHCIKASKKVKRRDIKRLVICKDCWSKMKFRKMYRNNMPNIKIEFVL